MRLLVALLCAACTLQSSPPDGCEVLAGMYHMRWELLEGDCPSLEEGTYDPSKTKCTGLVRTSADACTERFALTCPSGVGHYELAGEARWSSDGRTAEGVATFTAWINGRVICEGTYRTRMEKL